MSLCSSLPKKIVSPWFLNTGLITHEASKVAKEIEASKESKAKTTRDPFLLGGGGQLMLVFKTNNLYLFFVCFLICLLALFVPLFFPFFLLRLICLIFFGGRGVEQFYTFLHLHMYFQFIVWCLVVYD